MFEYIVPRIYFGKGKMLRTETDVKYIGDQVVIVPLEFNIWTLVIYDILENWHWQKPITISRQL